MQHKVSFVLQNVLITRKGGLALHAQCTLCEDDIFKICFSVWRRPTCSPAATTSSLLIGPAWPSHLGRLGLEFCQQTKIPISEKRAHLYLIFPGYIIRGRMVKFCHQFPLTSLLSGTKNRSIWSILYETHRTNFYVHKILKSIANFSCKLLKILNLFWSYITQKRIQLDTDFLKSSTDFKLSRTRAISTKQNHDC